MESVEETWSWLNPWEWFSLDAVYDCLRWIADHRPSRTLGRLLSGTAMVPAALKWLRFYSFEHSTAGPMIGSTLPGSSAANTIGIIANSDGFLGEAAKITLSPAVVATSKIAAGIILSWEAVGYFRDLLDHYASA